MMISSSVGSCLCAAPRRLLLAIAVLFLMTNAASAQSQPPDQVPLRMELPPDVRDWFRNPDGSCVQCSIGMCGVWCNVPAAATLLKNSTW